MLCSMFRPYDHSPLRMIVVFDGSAGANAAVEPLIANALRPTRLSGSTTEPRPAAPAEPAVPSGGRRIQVYPLEDV
jgi:hypothetical protein